MPNRMHGDPRVGAVDLCNGAVSEKKNATNCLTFVARWVRGCGFAANRSPGGEMWLNGQTDAHTDTTTTVTLAVHAHRGLMNMWLHDQSWIIRFLLFTGFEIQGLKPNNKKKNWENKLFVILSPLIVMQFLPYHSYLYILPIATILQWQNWIHIETESLNRIFSNVWVWCWETSSIPIRASVDTLCRDCVGQISCEHVQCSCLTR